MKKHTKLSHKEGLAPGTATYIGDNSPTPTSVNIISYNSESIHFKDINLNQINFVDDIKNTCVVASDIYWLRLSGFKDSDKIEAICSQFNIHPLIIEDILNTKQRAKTDYFDDCIYSIFHVYECAEQNDYSQLCVLLTGNVILTFYENNNPYFFAYIEKRLNLQKSKLRREKSDYLFYTLLDAVVDSYMPLLEKQGDTIERLDELLIKNPSKTFLDHLYNFKKEAAHLRKNILPLKEISNIYLKEEFEEISANTLTYFNDLHDHTIQLAERAESYRESLATMMDMYLSSMSNKMNDTMKILTIFSAIFIPLTFIAGLYGMNFDYIPELKWHYGYFYTLGIMVCIIVLLLYFFKRKEWF